MCGRSGGCILEQEMVKLVAGLCRHQSSFGRYPDGGGGVHAWRHHSSGGKTRRLRIQVRCSADLSHGFVHQPQGVQDTEKPSLRGERNMTLFTTILATIGGLAIGYMLRRPKKQEPVVLDNFLIGQFLGMMQNETDHKKVQEYLGNAIYHQMSLEREKQTRDRFVELSQDDWEMRRRMVWNLLDDIDLEIEGFIPFRCAVLHTHLDERGQWVCKPRPNIFREPKGNVERIADACERVMGDRANVERFGIGLVNVTKREPGDFVH